MKADNYCLDISNYFEVTPQKKTYIFKSKEKGLIKQKDTQIC